MRKILNKKDNSKQNQLILGLALVILLLFSTLGYAFSSKSSENSDLEKVIYNGIEFTPNSGYWFSKIQGYDLVTNYNANETKDVFVSSYLTLQDYRDKPLYIVSSNIEANTELARNLNSFVLRIQEACLNEDECIGNNPIKNCSIDNIIIIQPPLENEYAEVYREENCIFILADYENQTRYADAYLFKLFEI